MTTKELNILLKNKIIELAQSKSFVHHKRYVQYHLLVLEKLCLELMKHYPQANYDQVICLLWIHDYCKIVHTQEDKSYTSVYEFLIEIGFDENYADHIRQLLVIFESKMEFDLHQAPIEVQIVSSCDAFSHYIGPFAHLFSYENPHKDIEEIHQSWLRKIHKDWDRKITLKEAKKALDQRKSFLLDCFCAQMQDTYFAGDE